VSAALLLSSDAGTVRVTKDKMNMCTMVVGPVDRALLQEKLRNAALQTFRRPPHGRICELEAEAYPESDADSDKRMYVVTFPSQQERRFLLDATVWNRVKQSGIQAMITLIPTRRECPQC
jgi:hypothetical protein